MTSKGIPPAPPPPPPWHQRLLTVGVTGTNGKTSTTALVAAALSALVAPVPRATTVGFFLGEERLDVEQSHAGFLRLLELGLERGARYAAIELTSEALARGYIRAWPCRVGVFTNLTRDHLDAHGSAEHYLASKAQLFMHLPAGGTAVLNGCDPASALLAEVVPDGVTILRYGVASRGEPHYPLDIRASDVRSTWQGTEIDIVSGRRFTALPPRLSTRAIGDIFAENALAALLAAIAVGVPADLAARAIAEAEPPPGRFEVVGESPHVVVDYAHTPDAMARTIATARALCTGRLTVVFGAGGNRDQPKRPLMGRAATGADRILVTNDNPRDEDPMAIASAVRAGASDHPHAEILLDRAVAIRTAIREAGPDDVVLVAGKGHETTQQLGRNVLPFSDRDVIKAALAEVR